MIVQGIVSIFTFSSILTIANSAETTSHSGRLSKLLNPAIHTLYQENKLNVDMGVRHSLE